MLQSLTLFNNIIQKGILVNKKLILSAVLLTISSIKAECEPCCINDIKAINPDKYTISFDVEVTESCCPETRAFITETMNCCIEECRTCATKEAAIDACSNAAKACCNKNDVVVHGTITAQEAKPAEAQAEVAQEEAPAQEAA